MEPASNPYRNRNEADWLRASNDGMCKICGDDVGITRAGEPFVACHQCAFPVCRPCYEYERTDGTQACPNCRTQYKRHQGSPRIEGEETEEGEHDYDVYNNDEGDVYNEKKEHSMSLHRHLTYEAAHDWNPSAESTQPYSQIPLLTDSNHDSDELPSDHHPPPTPFTGGAGVGFPPSPYVDLNTPERSEESRSMDMSREFIPDDIAWKNRLENWKIKPDKMQIMAREVKDFLNHRQENAVDTQVSDEARQPLSRKVSIPSSRINPYRMVILLRLVIVGFFFKFRLQNPVKDAYALWLTSVICEVWFAVSWILDQFPKWFPINRQTYLGRLASRFEPEGHPSKLAAVDIFVSTVDPMKEPPLVTANTVLSILAVDYPVEKVSCYVSDDGAAMLTFETLSEAAEFARKWVPFCKKFNIEPRAPEMYFAQKIDYLKDKVQCTFVKERRVMKREYEEFKVRINALVAKAQKIPDSGWVMQDGTPWPGDNSRDHPGMIQVFLGPNGCHDAEGNELPHLVYVSREKRPGFNHHKKAGAMNSLVRVSGVLTNAPYILNLDCDHYINNSKCIREGMCFMMDPTTGKKCCFVQFPQRFDGIDCHDRYANHNTVFFDINLKGLDGVQGPVYVGTGCIFRRQALYGIQAPHVEKLPKDDCFLTSCCCHRKSEGSKPGRKSDRQHPVNQVSTTPMFNFEDIEEEADGYYDDHKSLLISARSYEKRFGQSHVFVASTLYEDGGIPEPAIPASLLKEAIHVISCGYEDKTEWGKEIGWIYGSVTEDILTGFKMHCRGWRSIYCMPARSAFKGSAPINLSDRLHQVLRWALGSVEISFSKHCPLWYGYGGRLKWLQRVAYINTAIYPLTSIPLIAYCTLPAICLLTGKFIIPTLSSVASLWFLSLFLSIFATAILEMRWSGVGVDEWWRNEQFWVIGGVSAHLFAVFQGLLKVVAGINTSFTVTAKAADEGFGELYVFKWTTLLIPPTTLIVINLVGVVAGLSDALNSGYQSWGPLFGKLFFAMWVILHLYPFLKGLMGRQNRTPTIVIVWSILLASIFSILWININPFLVRPRGPSLQQCGNAC